MKPKGVFAVTASTYLLEKIARHGAAANRLIRELSSREGEFFDHDPISAIAFDAADLVWAFLCLRGDEPAQESRQTRNAIAEQIINVLLSDADQQDR